MGRILKDISQFFHRGKPVSMMYHKGKLVYGGGGKPWEAYVQEGLLLQLDCTVDLTPHLWTSVKLKDKKAIAPYTFFLGEEAADISSGALLMTGRNAILGRPDITNDCKIEVVKKDLDADEVTIEIINGCSSAVGHGYKGYIYAVRYYDASAYSEETTAKNLAIDQKRFNPVQVPENALVDIDGNVILDADGNYIIMQ